MSDLIFKTIHFHQYTQGESFVCTGGGAGEEFFGRNPIGGGAGEQLLGEILYADAPWVPTVLLFHDKDMMKKKLVAERPNIYICCPL